MSIRTLSCRKSLSVQPLHATDTLFSLEDVWIADKNARALINGQENSAEIATEEPPRRRFRRLFRRNRSG